MGQSGTRQSLSKHWDSRMRGAQAFHELGGLCVESVEGRQEPGEGGPGSDKGQNIVFGECQWDSDKVTDCKESWNSFWITEVSSLLTDHCREYTSVNAAKTLSNLSDRDFSWEQLELNRSYLKVVRRGELITRSKTAPIIWENQDQFPKLKCR